MYHYYTTRQKNPLKGRQAVVAVGCKLIRVFYAILTRGVDYDANKLRTDIIPPQEQQRHPSAGRQNEGIEDSAEERMILLNMGGLLPQEKWDVYWPS